MISNIVPYGSIINVSKGIFLSFSDICVCSKKNLIAIYIHVIFVNIMESPFIFLNKDIDWLIDWIYLM